MTRKIIGADGHQMVVRSSLAGRLQQDGEAGIPPGLSWRRGSKGTSSAVAGDGEAPAFGGEV